MEKEVETTGREASFGETMGAETLYAETMCNL